MKKLITSSSTLWSCLIALVMMLAAQSAWAEYVPLTALSGTGGTGGEGYASLVDTKIDTKMGHSFDPANPDRALAYIIVKAEKAVVPEFYFLVTGGDTGTYPTRNWKTWKIFGGNFESDADAVRGDVDNPEATGWTLIDFKEDEPLPQANTTEVNLDFDYAGSEAFQYFWIEILESVEGSDVWLQMAEWGLGTYGDFQQYLTDLANQGTATDEPVNYYYFSGSPAGFSGEGTANLIDGNPTNKWCTSFTNRTQEGQTTNGGWIVFKASRAIAPTYYTMVTGNDTGTSPGRNWKKWRIYGMNAADDSNVNRDADGWVLIDNKENVPAGTELNQLPAASFATAYFTPSEENTTAYRYFKIEIDACVNDGLMQMSEFTFGDEFTFALDVNALLDATAQRYNAEEFAEAALYDQMAQLMANIESCPDPITLSQLTAQADVLVDQINASKNKYVELISARNSGINQLAEDNVADDAIEYVNGWTSETDIIEPNDDYPVGNFAYIKANRQLTGEEASAEARRFVAFLQANVKVVDDPIGDVGYVFLNGTTDNWNDGEGPAFLIDGDRDGTKWGTATGGDRFVIFKTNDNTPIKPTYYGLVTGGDTHIYTDRNWKNWKIWAANFDSDEDATKDAEGWVLIDEKENVGTDVLKTTSLFESYINLSIGCAVPYVYFKIEVYHEGGMQMNEFTFYNQGDLNIYREGFVSEFEDYDPTAEPAYKGYTDEFTEKYNELCTTGYAPDVMRLKNELVDLQDVIASSVDKYAEYEEWYNELVGAGAASEDLEAWYNGYTTENIAPNSVYINGTHDYIMENLQLDNDAIGRAADWDIQYNDDGQETGRTEILPSGEIGYIQNMVNASIDGVYILLGGHTVAQFNDGFYGHLIDGIALNTTDEDGNEVKATKWGGNADANGDTYIIFRTLNKTNPFFYTLTTGNDAEVYWTRNWGSWYIYGANFDGDADATKDAEGWDLIDNKENTGQDRLHPVNAEPSYFGFSTETTKEYTYYKVVVTKAYSGSQIQMNELHFGTPEEFEAIKDEYTDNANKFDADDYVADQALIDEYKATVPEIDECANMEALFRVNYKLETLRADIEASDALYAKFAENAEAYATEAESLSDSDAKTTLLSYLAEDAAEPTDEFEYGNVAYIIENHVLNDSILQTQIDFLEELRVAAVAAGYGEGADISCLIVNRTFAKTNATEEKPSGDLVAEGWNGNIYRSATSTADNEIYAAELVNQNAKFDVNQTLSNLKNGYYKVTLNAAYRANGDEKLLSYNYGAMAYANDVKTYIPVVLEGAVDEDDAWTGTIADHKIYTADSSEVLGWGVWGSEGSAHAFAQGRYAITLVAQVTDGTLTIGVKNDGTREWTAVGNFGLVYLGEEMDAEALAEAQECAQARIEVLNDLYYSTTEDEEGYADAPGFAAVQRAALEELIGAVPFSLDNLKSIGETMESIYYTKKAYAALFEATSKVYTKWCERNHDSFETDDVNTAEYAVYMIRASLDEGVYEDADAALAAKADLYTTFPDYLEITTESGKNKVIWEEFDAFTYFLQTDGTRPYVELKYIYEAIEKNEVILAFDYATVNEIPGGQVMYSTPNLMTEPKETLGALTATYDNPDADPVWATAYINVSQGISALNFGSGVDHGIRWYINYDATADDLYELNIAKFRFITMAEMKAAGGKPLNGIKGDVNNDGSVDGGDAQQILNVISDDGYEAALDVNGDGVIDGGDYQQILNIMSAE